MPTNNISFNLLNLLPLRDLVRAIDRLDGSNRSNYQEVKVFVQDDDGRWHPDTLECETVDYRR